MDRYDSIVVGAGPNGLTCATYLARAGQRVLVLEAADRPGGLAISREFHPGFHAPVAHAIGHFPRKIANDLGLPDAGFDAGAATLPTIGLGDDCVVLQDGSATGIGDDDAARLRSLSGQLERIAAALEPFWLKTLPGIGHNSLGEILTFAHLGLNIRRLGKADMHEFLRIVSLPTRDLMDENFDSELLKAVLCWDGLLGSKMAPRSPNGAVLAMLYRLVGGRGLSRVMPFDGSLVTALQRSLESHGGELRCASPVERCLVDEGSDGLAVTGVRLASGEELQADRVISSADPKTTFFRLVGIEHLEIEFANRIRRLRADGLVAKLHLALDGLPEFDVDDDLCAGRVIVAPDMETIEIAFDHAKYGELPERPVLEFVMPSVHDPACAPDGKSLLSAQVMYVPHALKGGWHDAAREQLLTRCIDVLAAHAPALREQLLAAELLTPADIERDFGVTGGHWHHGEFAIDQLLMMRPTYGAAQYRAPLAGLWLCGAGSHPAGDLTGMAGHNAAQEVLR